ncbi:hypothetical protein [Pseudomonas koreensis]|uniref:hypothetical protein n=1 Tax=Pseudomonas koreensis TaxID=198620 RepID=UPI0032090C7A
MAFGVPNYEVIPKTIYAYVCMQPPVAGTDYPWDCYYMEVQSSALNPVETGPTKEQYDAMFGAVLMVAALVIAFALIKKAIEQ